ncbi:MAG: IclR family transcriptional regulator [Bacillota bacterium]|nr:IclR family transcriptional regulator [Bacillota bacterium]
MTEQTLQTVDRALAILEILAYQPKGMRPTDIAASMHLNKVTVHRLLTTLLRRGFVERLDNGRYLIGLRLVAISSLRLNNLELKTEAQPWLRQLVDKVGQPVHLAIYDNGEIVYIEKMETFHYMRMYSQIGKRSPIHCTALGKILLSGMSDEAARDVLLARPLRRYTANTLTEPDLVLAEIREARRLGFALDKEEHEPEVFCVAAPVYDYRGQVIAAISTAGSRRDYLDNPQSEVISWIRETAGAISGRLGYDPSLGRDMEMEEPHE